MRIDARDVLTVAGLLMIGTGLWLIYPPVALIVIGALFFLAGTGKAVK